MEVKGLDPGEIYEFRVVSVDGKSMEHSDTQEIQMATEGNAFNFISHTFYASIPLYVVVGFFFLPRL